MNNAGLSSATVGRKPSDNPLSVLISFRIDGPTARALETELERMLDAQPGLRLSRADVARMLMTEGLLARLEKLKTRKPKK